MKQEIKSIADGLHTIPHTSLCEAIIESGKMIEKIRHAGLSKPEQRVAEEKILTMFAESVRTVANDPGWTEFSFPLKTHT